MAVEGSARGPTLASRCSGMSDDVAPGPPGRPLVAPWNSEQGTRSANLNGVPDLGLWPLRVAWLAAPLTAGPALAEALDPRTEPLRTGTSVALWLVWGAVLVATLVPRDVTLTVVRLVVPASVLAAGWAAAAGASTPAGSIAIAGAVVAAALACSPAVADAFVDGSSYGPERRSALRVPAPLLFGPVPLAWLAAVVGLSAGPLLLGVGRWVLGGVVLVVGWAVAAAAIRALHTLSRRWVVLVPAGLVLHDPLAGEALLFPRSSIGRLGPATVDTAATAATAATGTTGGEAPAGGTVQDRTGGALGLVLELEFTEPMEVPIPVTRGRVRRDDPHAPTVQVDRLLLSAVRPAALLDAAAGHRIRVGS